MAADARQSVSDILSRVHLIPLDFGELFDMPPSYAIHELGGNILLTVPLGFGIPLLTRLKTRQLPWLALAAGLSPELAQLILCLLVGGNYHSVDINDILLNAIGVLLGYGLFLGAAWLSALTFCHFYQTNPLQSEQ